MSVIESISAGGVVIPPLIIIKGVVIQSRWFSDIENNDVAIGVSDSGYSNDLLCFQWLQHWVRLRRRSQMEDTAFLLWMDTNLIYLFNFFGTVSFIKLLFFDFQLTQRTSFHLWMWSSFSSGSIGILKLLIEQCVRALVILIDKHSSLILNQLKRTAQSVPSYEQEISALMRFSTKEKCLQY
jgi:hypothetical protein